MTALIGLLGGECTGKSALAARLGAELPACVVPEAVREFMVRTGRPPRVDEQRALMHAQQAAVREAAASCSHAVVVADPTPLMVAVYSVLYFDDDSLLAEGLADAATYDLLVWCAPDIPWEPDPGVRDGPEFRDRAEQILQVAVVPRLATRPSVVARGSLDTRLDQVRRAWQTLGSGEPT